MRIIDASITPPKGWFYDVPDTKVTVQAQDLPQLVSAVINHLKANSLPIPPTIAQLVEDQICARIPHGLCRSHQSTPLSSAPPPTQAQVLAGTATLGEWLLKGARRVDQSVANERARVCSTCTMNKPPQGCSGCHASAIRDMVGKVVGKLGTPYDDSLHVCLSCGCALRASVWLPLDIQQKHINDEVNGSLPKHCWKKRSMS